MARQSPTLVLILQLLLVPLLTGHCHAADGHAAPHVHLATLFGEADDHDADHDHDAVYLPEFDLAPPGTSSACADLDDIALVADFLPCPAPPRVAPLAGRPAAGRPPDPPFCLRNRALLL